MRITNPGIPIFIFYDHLTENQKKSLSGCNAIRIKPEFTNALFRKREKLTDAIFFKFYLEMINGIDKVLFLDSDMVILEPLDGIFKLEGKIIARGVDVNLAHEFKDVEKVKKNEKIREGDLLLNAGVVCFDRKFWVRERITEKVGEIVNMYGMDNFSNPEQGILNILAYRYGGFTNISKLYNYTCWFDMLGDGRHNVRRNPLGIKAPYIGNNFAKILHWNVPIKPWHFIELVNLSPKRKGYYYECYQQFVGLQTLLWLFIDFVGIGWRKIKRFFYGFVKVVCF